jgi:hypothetical protein
MFVGAAAWAQSPPPEPPSVQYICLSNSCFKPQTPAAPRTASRIAPRTAPGAAGETAASVAAIQAAMQAGIQAGMADRLLNGMTDDERSTARFSEAVVGDRVGARVDFQRADGTRGSRTIVLAPPSPP